MCVCVVAVCLLFRLGFFVVVIFLFFRVRVSVCYLESKIWLQ